MKGPSHASTDSNSPARAIRVVVVDDSELGRMALKNLLGRQPGIEVIALACSGAEGLAAAAEFQPELVVTDFQMPGFDGLELARRLRREQPAIRIVITSVYDAPTLLSLSRREGADAFIPKQKLPQELPPLLKQLFPLPAGSSTTKGSVCLNEKTQS